MFKKLIQAARNVLPDSWARYFGCLLITAFCVTGIALLDFDRLFQSDSSVVNSSATRRAIFKTLSYSAFVENWLYDARSQYLYQNDGVQAPNIAILQVTDKSLNKIGRWPWSRATHAELVTRLDKVDAKSVLFDVFFPEPERVCLDPQSKNNSLSATTPDQLLANAIEHFQAKPHHSIIIGFTTTRNDDEKLPEPPIDAFLNDNMLSGGLGTPDEKLDFQGPPFVNKYNFPIKELLDKKVHLGFLESEPDIDGVFRYAGIFTNSDDFPVMSGGFALFHHYFKEKPEDKIILHREPSSLSYLYTITIQKDDQKPFSFPVNASGEVLVRYLGDENAFVNYDISDFLLDDFSKPEIVRKWQTRLSSKAVIIGSVATGAHDLRHTPVNPKLPGMYSHANVFHMLDQQYFYQPIKASIRISLLALLLGVSLVLVLSNLGMPAVEILFVFGIMGLYYWLDHNYFLPEGYRLALFFIGFGIVGSYMWVTFLNVLKEIRERLKIRNTFTRYVSKDVVKEVLANPDKLKLGGEKRVISMLFSDVRSFTSISEQLTPQELTFLLNTYMNRMTQILFANRGTLDKYIGDAMVAFWGAPVDLPDHPVHAVSAAVQMMEALPEINENFAKRKLPTISTGIGINTGEVSVGNMGSDQIFAYTALGDHMNLASRLESLTKYYSAGLLISEYTYKAMGPAAANFRMRPLDRVQVKGREEPVTIYEVFPKQHKLYNETELLADLSQAFTLYLRRDFPLAAELFEKANQKVPDAQIQKLLDRCLELIAKPPAPDWNGVTVFTEK